MEQQGSTNTSSKPVVAMPKMTGAQELLKQAWAKYKANYELYSGIIAIPILLTTIITLLGMSDKGPGSPLTALGIVALALVTAVVSIWSQASLMTVVTDSEGMVKTIDQAYEMSWKKLWKYFILVVAVGLMVLGGTILLIIPGIIFMIWFAFAQFVFFEEKIENIDAAWKSKAYVKDYFWPVVWRMLFAIVIYFIGLIFVNILGSFVSGNNQMVNQILGMVYGVFMGPVLTIYQYGVYKNLKAIKGANVA